MRRNNIPGKHEESRGKKRREETDKRTRRKTLQFLPILVQTYQFE
jgi:hypothetical protein